MYLKHIFYSLPFLVSFACSNGFLNENSYVKQFGFGIAFLFMGMISIIQKKSWTRTSIKIFASDIFILFLLVLYVYFYWGTHNDLDYSLPIIYFLFYCFIRIYTQGEEKEIIPLLTKIASITIFIHIIICCLQFANISPNFHNYFPVGSTFGNPDKLGAYLSVLLPFCYINQKQKIIGYSLLLLSIILLLLLQARTALVATVLTGIFYLFLTKKLQKKYFLWGLIPLIVGVFALIWWHPASVSGRLFTWIVATLMIISKPQGWGLYAFQKHYPEFQSKFIMHHPEIVNNFNVDIVHSPFNEFLNIGVTLGILGLLCYILFVIYILISAYRTRSLLLFPLISFQIISFSYFPYQIVSLCFIFVLLVAININSIIIQVKVINKALLIISILLITTFLSFSNLQNYRQWQLAVRYAQNEEMYDDSNRIFKKQYASMKGNGLFLLSYAEFLDKTGDTGASFSLLKQTENYYSDPFFLRILALACENAGNINEAKCKFDMAVNMIPEQFNIAYEQILFLQRTGEKQEAYELALKLYNKPIKSTAYIDPFIIKEKLKTMLQSYPKETD
jgi:tetratricopeptide (TPR) repeat protein